MRAIMKRIQFSSILSIAAVSAALLSCQKEQTLSSPAFYVEVAPAETDTKATFADGAGMSWEDSDNSLFRMVAGTDISTFAVSTAKSVSIDDKGVATFAFDAAPAEGSTVSFFYGPGSNLEYTFSPNQTQAAPGKIDAANLCFKAVDVAVTEASAAPAMQMVGSVQRFLIYSSTGKYAAEKVEAIKITSSNENITGLIGYNGLGQPRKNPGADYTAAETETIIWSGSKSVTVNVSNPVAIEAKDQNSTKGKGIYISIPAGSISSYTYQITTDQAEYIYTSTNAKTYGNGKVSNVFINLENASIVRGEKGSVIPEVKYTGGLPDTFTLNADATTDQGISWWYATVDGSTRENRVESSYDGTIFYSTENVKFTATDESGNAVDWISCKYKTNDTWWQVTYTANETGAERTAYITATYNIPGYIATPATKTVKVIQPAKSK